MSKPVSELWRELRAPTCVIDHDTDGYRWNDEGTPYCPECDNDAATKQKLKKVRKRTYDALLEALEAWHDYEQKAESGQAGPQQIEDERLKARRLTRQALNTIREALGEQG